MAGKSIVIAKKNDFQAIVQLVQDSLTSENSRIAYGKALEDFLSWYDSHDRPGLTKATVQRYKKALQDQGLSSSSINQKLSAIRKLAAEAADNGLVDQGIAAGIARVKGVKASGVRYGNWLDKHQAQQLLDSPDAGRLKGLRDRAILAVMVGAGLRRSEVVALTFAHVQQRDARWVIVDLVGKGKRVRSIPIPSWIKTAVDAWSQGAGISDGRIFRRVNKGGRLASDCMTPQAVQDVVKTYAAVCLFGLAAHDLRRTFAKLAHKGGAGIDQIQLSLGHASMTTTERYLGVKQDLVDAPGDRLGLRLA